MPVPEQAYAEYSHAHHGEITQAVISLCSWKSFSVMLPAYHNGQTLHTYQVLLNLWLQNDHSLSRL